MAVSADVTQERQLQALVNAVLSKYESVDVLVNCAGVFGRGTFEDTPAMEAKRLMDVNYMGPFMTTQAFLPVLLKSGARARGMFGGGGGERPSVIMLTGFSGRVPTKYMSAFSASKAALEALAVSLRTEVEGQGVHVGVVQPGLVKSNLLERAAFYGRNGEEDR
ncbi:Dehydrogenase/reductase SDR family member 7B, partial [Tetrabaena socialis]